SALDPPALRLRAHARPGPLPRDRHRRPPAAGRAGQGHGLLGIRHPPGARQRHLDRKSTRLNSSHVSISYAVFCLKKKNITYDVGVKNNGPSPATSVVVSDPTPVGLAFISNAGACTTPYPCSLGTLNSGPTASITT